MIVLPNRTAEPCARIRRADYSMPARRIEPAPQRLAHGAADRHGDDASRNRRSRFGHN
jgi:hypothetical protein